MMSSFCASAETVHRAACFWIAQGRCRQLLQDCTQAFFIFFWRFLFVVWICFFENEEGSNRSRLAHCSFFIFKSSKKTMWVSPTCVHCYVRSNWAFCLSVWKTITDSCRSQSFPFMTRRCLNSVSPSTSPDSPTRWVAVPFGRPLAASKHQCWISCQLLERQSSRDIKA